MSWVKKVSVAYHFDHDTSKAPDISGSSDFRALPTANHLRWHVAWRSGLLTNLIGAGAVGLGELDHLGEIANFNLTTGREKDVLALDVEMADAILVEVGHAEEQLLRVDAHHHHVQALPRHVAHRAAWAEKQDEKVEKNVEKVEK